jgi:hypothetical protein
MVRAAFDGDGRNFHHPRLRLVFAAWLRTPTTAHALILLALFGDIQGQSDAVFAVQQLVCCEAMLPGISGSAGISESSYHLMQSRFRMSRQIDYYFSLQSPWAYIGHKPFARLVSTYDLKVNYRPVLLVDLFSETGGLPLAQRHPVRQRYRMIELQRWRDKRGLN